MKRKRKEDVFNKDDDMRFLMTYTWSFKEFFFIKNEIWRWVGWLTDELFRGAWLCWFLCEKKAFCNYETKMQYGFCMCKPSTN